MRINIISTRRMFSLTRYVILDSVLRFLVYREEKTERMAALLVGRFKAIRGAILVAVRQSGNSYERARACAVAVRSQLPVNLYARRRLLSDHSGRRFISGNAKPEVDYSRLISVKREAGRMAAYNAVWLRENCRCDVCVVGTRAVVYHRLPPEAFLANQVTWASQEGVVEVTWGDGHLSR